MRNFCPIPDRAAEFLRRLGTAAIGLIYPPHCAACGAATAFDVHVCESCAGKTERIVAPFCRGCSEPFAGEITRAFLCAECRERDFQFTCAVSPYRATGIVREFILRFKYERHFYLRHQLADWLAEGLPDERLRDPAPELLIPVPLHSARKRHREFNQAQVLAALLSERSGFPLLEALERVRYTTTQPYIEAAWKSA